MIKKRKKTRLTKKEFDKLQQEIYCSSTKVWRDNMLNDYGKVKL